MNGLSVRMTVILLLPWLAWSPGLSPNHFPPQVSTESRWAHPSLFDEQALASIGISYRGSASQLGSTVREKILSWVITLFRKEEVASWTPDPTYESDSAHLWDDAMSPNARIYSPSPNSFIRKLFNQEHQEQPIGGIGILIDVPWIVQWRLDSWVRYLHKRLNSTSISTLSQKVHFLPRRKRHLTLAALGYGPSFSDGPEAYRGLVQDIRERTEEVVRYRREVLGKLGNITTFHRDGAVAAEISFSSKDLRRMNQIQTALGAQAKHDAQGLEMIHHYHVTIAWFEELNEEETAEWKRILADLREHISRESQRKRPVYFWIDKLHIRSFSGFFQNTWHFGAYRLLSKKRFENAVARGKKLLIDAMGLTRPLDLDTEEQQMKLYSWLGLFSTIFLENPQSLEAALGMKNIPAAAIKLLNENLETLRVTVHMRPTGIQFLITGNHPRPGLLRTVTTLVKAYGGQLTRLTALPRDERKTPVEIEAIIKPLNPYSLSQLSRAIGKIPDLKMIDLSMFHSGFRRRLSFSNQLRHARATMEIPDDPDRLRLLLQAIFDSGDVRISIPRINAQALENGFMRLAIELLIPREVSLSALATRMIFAGRGRFIEPMEEFKTSQESDEDLLRLAQIAVHAQDDLLRHVSVFKADYVPQGTILQHHLEAREKHLERKDFNKLIAIDSKKALLGRLEEIPLRDMSKTHRAQYIEKPSEDIVDKILNVGGTILKVNAYGYGWKGVFWELDGETYFTPLTVDDYAKLTSSSSHPSQRFPIETISA